MKSVLISSLLLAVATAAPVAPGRPAKRLAPGLHSHQLVRANYTGAQPESANDNPTIESYNWSGGYVQGSGITEVYGTVVVPAVSVPPGGDPNTQYSGAAWVGIDGNDDQCGTLLQTGIDWQVGGGQGPTYGAWFEWVPDQYLMTFDGFSVSQGDTIVMKVVASSDSGSTGGAAYITNISTGQSISHTFSGQTALKCQSNAEWIVEDLTVGGSFAPFASFDPIAITAAGWGNDQGTYDISGAGIYTLITSNGQSETDVSIPNSMEVDVSYV